MEERQRVFIGVTLLPGSQYFVMVATNKYQHLLAYKPVDDIIGLYQEWITGNKVIEDSEWNEEIWWQTNKEMKFSSVVKYVNKFSDIWNLPFYLPTNLSNYMRWIKRFPHDIDYRKELIKNDTRNISIIE